MTPRSLISTIGATALGFGLLIGGVSQGVYAQDGTPVAGSSTTAATSAAAPAATREDQMAAFQAERAASYEAFVQSMADQLSLPTDQVDTAIRESLKAAVDTKLAAGDIDKERAAAAKAVIDVADAPLALGFGGPGMGGPGGPGMGGPGGPGMGGPGGHGPMAGIGGPKGDHAGRGRGARGEGGMGEFMPAFSGRGGPMDGFGGDVEITRGADGHSITITRGSDEKAPAAPVAPDEDAPAANEDDQANVSTYPTATGLIGSPATFSGASVDL